MQRTPDGAVYEGEWRADARWGEGTWIGPRQVYVSPKAAEALGTAREKGAADVDARTPVGEDK